MASALARTCVTMPPRLALSRAMAPQSRPASVPSASPTLRAMRNDRSPLAMRSAARMRRCMPMRVQAAFAAERYSATAIVAAANRTPPSPGK